MLRATSRAPAPLEEPPDPGHVRWLLIVTAVVIGRLWLMPLFSSLWLDELGTWWVVKDGVGDTVHRALTFHGQSPLYYLIVWTARVVGGNSEVVLRLPSLIAAAVSAFLLYRLARNLIATEAARFTVLVFAATQTVAFEASEARPYALATLAVIASTYALVRWLDDGRRWSPALLYALLAVTVVWMHYLFALVLVRPRALRDRPAAAWRDRGVRSPTGRGRRDRDGRHRARWRSSSPRCGIDARPSRSRAKRPWRCSRSSCVPPVLVVSVFLGSLIARMRDPVRIAPVPARSSTLVLLGSWLLFPVVTLFLVSTLTPVDFLSPRYFASVRPAIALFGGWGIASLEPAAVRRIIAVVLAMLSVLAYGGTSKNGEDWRGAAAFEREHADSRHDRPVAPRRSWSRRSWIGSPIRRSGATSCRCSPTIRWKGDVTPMPYMLDDESRDYLEVS